MSCIQQVQLFNSASGVVGMRGAGVPNLAFMLKGGKVVELWKTDRQWHTYRGVAARSVLEHFPYFGARAGEIREADSDVSVDVGHFIGFVAEVCDCYLTGDGVPGEPNRGRNACGEIGDWRR